MYFLKRMMAAYFICKGNSIYLLIEANEMLLMISLNNINTIRGQIPLVLGAARHQPKIINIYSSARLLFSSCAWPWEVSVPHTPYHSFR
ncbi:hypothetical protein GDO81_005425 [Engystomops pustulosus]|uniref:Uncharacterized protein n=1 Tax=Engystomops pustulosus TaxID=76066 RepID=A0AAV7CPE2_ENGPU|nr:hypothetical protein GDO81_005425 [Engystomops pustulosus]